MNFKYGLLSACLVLQANVWAADTPVVETPATVVPVADVAPATQPATPAPTTIVPIVEEDIEVELPVGFIEAQPQPILPPKGIQPVAPPKPAVEILPYQVELGGNYAKLSNGARDGSVYLAAEMKLDTRNNIYASFRRENRYAFMDNEAMGGFYQPIDEQFSFVAEMSVSPTHYVVPSRSILAQLEFLGLKGWGANVGLRHAEYDKALMNVLSMNVERSWGNYRLAYSHFQGFWANHGSTSSGQLQAARYYGDYNWFGLNFSDGSELDSLPDLQVTSTNVRTMIVNGRHWVNRSVALTYAIGQSRHGNFYTRNGIQLGLRYQF